MSTARFRRSSRKTIVLEHTALIRYIVNRIAVRLPSHIDLDDLHNTGVIGSDGRDREVRSRRRTASSRPTPSSASRAPFSTSFARSTGCRASVRQKSRKLESVPTARSSSGSGRQATEEEVADSLGLQIDKFHDLLNQVRGISLVNLEEIRGTNSDGDRVRHLRRHHRGRDRREPVRVAQERSRRSTSSETRSARCRRRSAWSSRCTTTRI